MDEVKIGDFTKPVVSPMQRVAAAAAAASATATSGASTVSTARPTTAASPEAERLDATEKRLAEQAQETEEALQPKINYEEQLKAAGITKDEAARIVDNLLFKGCYAEEVPLSARVKVAFRTRQARDTARTLTYLEVVRPIYENHVNEVVSKHSLAASLERLGQDRFEFPSKDASTDKVEEAFQTRLTYINGLPDPVLRLLFLKLVKFDEKVRVVLQEGAIENF